MRRATAYRVRRSDGSSFYVWGPPARVQPSDALDRPESIAKWALWLALATLALIAVFWAAVR